MQITIDDIQRTGHTWQRILPIQSAKQFGSYIACSLLGFLLFQAVLAALDLTPATLLILAGAFGGSSVALWTVLPATLRVRAASPEDGARLLRDVIARVESYGYQRLAPSGPVIRLQPRLPSLLRWDENSFHLDRSGAVVDIRGPIATLRVLRASLQSNTPG